MICICAGYISADPINSKLQVIANERQNADGVRRRRPSRLSEPGRKDGVKVGDVYVVVRPEGKFKNEFNKKKLGYSNLELGVIKVVASQYSTRDRRCSFCREAFKNGDYLKPVERRPNPEIRSYKPLEKYNDNTLRLTALLGQIVDTRYHQGTAVERTIVHTDLVMDGRRHSRRLFMS